MKRVLITLAGFALAAGLASAVGAQGPKSATITIRHQTHGCHSWAVNGGAYRATLSTRVARGATVKIVDNDVMPHKLVKTSGPAVHYVGMPAMKHMGAFVKVVFTKAGIYHFTTKPGEDYMKGIKTTGEDNVLRLTVKVS